MWKNTFVETIWKSRPEFSTWVWSSCSSYCGAAPSPGPPPSMLIWLAIIDAKLQYILGTNGPAGRVCRAPSSSGCWTPGSRAAKPADWMSSAAGADGGGADTSEESLLKVFRRKKRSHLKNVWIWSLPENRRGTFCIFDQPKAAVSQQSIKVQEVQPQLHVTHQFASESYIIYICQKFLKIY